MTATPYTVANFPHFVCNHGNWDIFASATGYCAAIPTAQAAANGCQPSHFGDANYTAARLGLDPALIKRA